MTTPSSTGVWINASGATIVRWGPEGLSLRERFDSEVPSQHRANGGPPIEFHGKKSQHREEHLRIFFAKVAALLPPGDDLLLLGDGEVVEHLGTHLREQGHGHGVNRRLVVEKSHPVTEPQLIAALRAFAGQSPKRGR